MKTTIHDTAKRPWGYETLTTIIADDADIYNECIVTKEYPEDTMTIVALAEERVLAKIARKAAEVDEPTINDLEEQKQTLMDEIVALGAQKAALGAEIK